ncbi:MAG TPA: hypothetical protein VF444_15605 [Pseudonocardiaceae bacterium]
MADEDDIEKLIAWAVANGWTIRVDNKGYRRFYEPNGEFVVKYPNTPSRSRRRYLDVKTALKRNGLEIPPPSKAELRRRARTEDT